MGTGKPLQFPRGAGQDERVTKRLVSCPGGMLWYANAVGMGRIAFPFVYVPCYAPHRHIGKSDRIRKCSVNSKRSSMVQPRHAASFYPQYPEEKAASPKQSGCLRQSAGLAGFPASIVPESTEKLRELRFFRRGRNHDFHTVLQRLWIQRRKKASKHVLQDIHQMKRV